MSLPPCTTYGEQYRQNPLTGALQKRDPVTGQTSMAGANSINNADTLFGDNLGPKADKAAPNATDGAASLSGAAGLAVLLFGAGH